MKKPADSQPPEETVAPSKGEKALLVRYSLPHLLEEIRDERANGSFAMEKLHQVEISKLFVNNPRSRRGKAKR